MLSLDEDEYAFQTLCEGKSLHEILTYMKTNMPTITFTKAMIKIALKASLGRKAANSLLCTYQYFDVERWYDMMESLCDGSVPMRKDECLKLTVIISSTFMTRVRHEYFIVENHNAIDSIKNYVNVDLVTEVLRDSILDAEDNNPTYDVDDLLQNLFKECMYTYLASCHTKYLFEKQYGDWIITIFQSFGCPNITQLLTYHEDTKKLHLLGLKCMNDTNMVLPVENLNVFHGQCLILQMFVESHTPWVGSYKHKPKLFSLKNSTIGNTILFMYGSDFRKIGKIVHFKCYNNEGCENIDEYYFSEDIIEAISNSEDALNFRNHDLKFEVDDNDMSFTVTLKAIYTTV